MIRVLIAEGSPFQVNFLSLALKQSGVAESVGVARNGEDAIVLTHRFNPPGQINARDVVFWFEDPTGH